MDSVRSHTKVSPLVFIRLSSLPPEPFCLASYPSAFHSVMFNPVEPRLLATANSKEGIGLWDIRKPRRSDISRFSLAIDKRKWFFFKVKNEFSLVLLSMSCFILSDLNQAYIFSSHPPDGAISLLLKTVHLFQKCRTFSLEKIGKRTKKKNPKYLYQEDENTEVCWVFS